MRELLVRQVGGIGGAGVECGGPLGEWDWGWLSELSSPPVLIRYGPLS